VALRRGTRDRPVTLFFPAFPRFFKNFEVLAEAAKLSRTKAFRVVFTLKGSENRYAREVYQRFSDVKTVEFVGLLPRTRVEELYNEVDALVFPSRLESWGLPLTEFQATGKPIFAADLPYARETLSGYRQASFFDPHDPGRLAELFDRFAEGEFSPSPSNVQPAPPFASNWDEFVSELKARFDI
jgi:glycosyltransferase involved in cell wall biosynthesis